MINKNNAQSTKMQNISTILKSSRDVEQFVLDNNNDKNNINMNTAKAKKMKVENLLLSDSVNVINRFCPKSAGYNYNNNNNNNNNNDKSKLSLQNASSEYTKEIINCAKEKERKPPSLQRVKVEVMQTHSQLQNNVWNHAYHPLNSSAEKTAINEEILNRNESAFTDKNIVIESMTKPSSDAESKTVRAITEPTESTAAICWTGNPESTFRRIEDVHNYAKLKRNSFSNGSSSSLLEDEDDDGDDDDCDNEEGNGGNDLNEYDGIYDDEDYVLKRKVPCRNVSITNEEHNSTDLNKSELTKGNVGNNSYNLIKAPDHHARRPMNAFLIFCKRHRAIVKEKYKTCENRAITKILGDWWASLDNNEKKSYTNLAKQNKDAFFSANPNFKWYKLPAPPLRTAAANSRPACTDLDMEEDLESQETSKHMAKRDDINGAQTTTSRLDNSNYFRFADERQMGDLSTLICSSSNEKPSITQSTKSSSALQKVLGETSDFLKITIPQTETSEMKCSGKSIETGTDNNKRLKQTDHISSSTSSEEEKYPVKFSRSCKGKKYQELITSGEMAAISSSSSSSNSGSGNNKTKLYNDNSNRKGSSAFHCDKFLQTSTSTQESQIKYDMNTANTFDLEDKIRSLPVLSLEVYLQRKRNTKKKKINSKKRKTSSAAVTKSSISISLAPSSTTHPLKKGPHIKEVTSTSCTQMVGSQKRKARKESITRRDINKMETIDRLPSDDNYTELIFPYSSNISSATSKTPFNDKMQPNNNSLCEMFTLNNNNFPTSDLLILAEVAANHTETIVRQ